MKPLAPSAGWRAPRRCRGRSAMRLRRRRDRSSQPYQMVRSLQLVQDRIAGGDHAALPMQRKLLEMIDARFARDDQHAASTTCSIGAPCWSTP